MVKAIQKWAAKPYCSKVPGRRFVHNYEAKPCNHCGSVVVIGGDLLRQSQKYNRVFCDIECANEYKKWHNRTEEYREKSGVKSLLPHEADKLKRDRSCTICIGCCTVIAFDAKLCADCSRWKINSVRRAERSILRISLLIDRECERCGVSFEGSKFKRFCSPVCARRHYASDHRHRRRVLFCLMEKKESIGLATLAKRFNWVCSMCGCTCNKSTGTYDPKAATIDHIVPVSKGGTHTWDNVRLACFLCNSLRSDQPHEGQLLLPLSGGGKRIKRKKPR